MRQGQHSDEVRAVDIEVGGDDDMPGIALELTADDVDDIALDPHLTVRERRRQLMSLLEELRARRAGDKMGDMEELSSHVRDRLYALGDRMESQTVYESTGMYPEDRSDDDDPADHIDDEDAEEDGGP